MHQYEIRVLRDNNRPLIVSSRFLGDFHAIRRAHAMAEEEEGLEVWRGMKCLYRRNPLAKDLLPAEDAAFPYAGAARERDTHIA
jgi:hypothetical protein